MAASFYLGPDRGRWVPSGWEDLTAAAAAGTLDEMAWVELKEKLPSSTTGKNLELAKDLASLAVDGGLFVVGVAEDPRVKGKAGEVRGVANPAADLDRLDQIARDRVHPPLFISGMTITDPDRPGVGCLLVTVPISPSAPHMADERYWGRGATGKRVLPDGDVRRLMARRQSDAESFVRKLRELADLDPVPEEGRSGAAHLYVLAQPIAARADGLVELTTGGPGDLTTRLRAEALVVEAKNPWQPSPKISNCLSFVREADGISVNTGPSRPEDATLACHVREDGGLALICGRGSESDGGMLRLNPHLVIVPVVVLGLARDAVALAARLADNHSGYQGGWNIGLCLDRLRGVLPADILNNPYVGHHPYQGDEYVMTTTATTEEMATRPDAVVERLTGKLLRSLGVESRYRQESSG